MTGTAVALPRKSQVPSLILRAAADHGQTLVRSRSLAARRTKAFLMDSVLIAALSLGLASTLLFTLPSLLIFAPFLGILMLPLSFAYFAVTQGSMWSASPGMAAFGLKVATKQGGRLGIRTALIRTFLMWASMILLTPLILLLIPVSRGRWALHDVMVGARVLDRSLPSA